MLTFLKPVLSTDHRVRSCWTTGENIAAERKVCLKPACNCWACLCNTFMFFWVKTLFFSDKQTVYPGVSEGAGGARLGHRFIEIESAKARGRLSLQTHFHKIEAPASASDVALCWRTSAPLLRVQCCIFDKHHTSQMFTKDVCQRVFGALTKSLEIWYVGLVDVFQPSGKC